MVLAACESCDYRLEGLWDPALPEVIEPEYQEAILVLDTLGSSPLSIASAIRPLTGLTSQAALSLVRGDHPEIARRPAERVWELENLQARLTALGATCTIHRLS
ncbi:MAG: hypothetical protein V4710_13745 [Verrucomicrobiota bacterium]